MLPSRALLATARPRDAWERRAAALALAGGLSWGWSRLRDYPPGYLFPIHLDIWPVQLATIAGLLAGSAGLAFVLFAPVLPGRRLAAPLERSETNGGGWAFALPLLLLSAAARLSFWRELPGAVWTDVVYAVHAAAQAGRFLWPWEAVPLVPPEVGGSRVLLFGLYVDAVRGLLAASPDRLLAAHLLSAVPGLLLPPALWLLVRRVAGETTARVAGLLLALSFPALVQSRWGWVQQAMLLLQLLALERAAAGLRPGGGRALAASGLLAGISLHTYVASFPATGALAAALAAVSYRRRSPRPLAAFAAGIALPALLLAAVYAVRPDALGGRTTEVSLLSRPAGVAAASFLANAVEHVGAFFFSADPNTRHGDPGAPAFGLAFAALLPLGVARARGERWLVVGAGLLGSLAGGCLTVRFLTPNTFRIGLALVLASAVAASALAGLEAIPVGSARFRSLLPLLAALLLGASDHRRFLGWGLGPGRPPQVAQVARAAGEFLAVAGPSRVLLDPSLFSKEDSPLVAGFYFRPDATLEPLLRPRAGALALPDAAVARPAWFVTNRPPKGAAGIRLGAPGTAEAPAFALRLAPGTAGAVPAPPL